MIRAERNSARLKSVRLAMLDLRKDLSLPPYEAERTLPGLVALARCAIARAKHSTAEDVEALLPAVLRYVWPYAGILQASAHREEDGQTTVATFIHDPKKAHTEPRRFDLLFYFAVTLVASVGGVFFYHGADDADKERTYVRVRHGSRAEQRIYISRVIRDTPSGKVTPFAEDFRSYRYKDLKEQRGGKGKPARLGRKHFVALGQSLFEKRYPDGLPGLTATDFTDLLAELLVVASIFHGEDTEQ